MLSSSKIFFLGKENLRNYCRLKDAQPDMIIKYDSGFDPGPDFLLFLSFLFFFLMATLTAHGVPRPGTESRP